jgi:uncharacterized protein
MGPITGPSVKTHVSRFRVSPWNSWLRILLAAAIPALPVICSCSGEKDAAWTERVERNGKWIATTYVRNRDGGKVIHGSQIISGETGAKESECGFDMGLVNGDCREWYPNGRLKWDCGYEHGKKNGRCTYYYEDGGKQSRDFFASDSLIGESASWYPNGKVRSVSNDSQAMAYFPDGNPEWRSRLSKGLKDGVSEVWWPNGRLRESTTFRKGLLHGPADSYYENGEVECRFEYSAGRLISEKRWDE